MTRITYPFHASLRDSLRTVSAPLDALRLVRHIEFCLDVSSSEAEIVLVLLSRRNQVITAEVVHDELKHLTPANIKRLLSTLIKKNFAIETKTGGLKSYSILPDLAARIKEVSKEMLNSPK